MPYPSYTVTATASPPCTCCNITGGIICRVKPGLTATLCGYREFYTDEIPEDNPQRRFRKKTYKTTRPFEYSVWPGVEDCAYPTCRTDWDGSFDGYISGVPWAISVNGSATFTGISGGAAHYLVHCSGTFPGDPPSDLSTRVSIGWDGGSATGSDGDTLSVPTEGLLNVSLGFLYVSWQTAITGCVQPSLSRPTINTDVWDWEGQYDKDSCDLTETNNSLRNGETTIVPSDDPPYYYSGHLTEITHTLYKIKWLGIGCLANGYGDSELWDSISTITTELSDEDTKDDAIARAKAATEDPYEWGAPVDCDAGHGGTTFITDNGDSDTFAFREGQVRGIFPYGYGTLDHTYKFTIKIYARDAGTGDPFVTFSVLEIVYHIPPDATAPLQTDWVDMPMEPGKELQATSCIVTEA